MLVASSYAFPGCIHSDDPLAGARRALLELGGAGFGSLVPVAEATSDQGLPIQNMGRILVALAGVASVAEAAKLTVASPSIFAGDLTTNATLTVHGSGFA